MCLFNKSGRSFNCMPDISKNEKWNEIALIQILSALLIVNYHTSNLNVPLLHNFARFGFVFNTVFVGLSGYLLALSARGKGWTIDWIWRRFMRLYPPYWAAIVFIVIIQYFIGQSITLPDIALHLTGLHYFFGNAVLGRHLWFVSVIIACYFLFWPSLFLIRRKPLIFLSVLICGFILTVLLINGTTENIYSQVSSVPLFRFFYHYIVFALGIFIAAKDVQVVKTGKFNPILFIIVLVMVLILYELAKNNASYSLAAVIMAVFIAGLFCMLVVNVFKYVKSWRPLFYLSGITYEIYLIHYSCINLSGYLFSGFAAYLAVFAGTIVVAFVIRYVLILTRLQRI